MNIDLTKTQQYLEWLKNKLYLNAIAPSAKNRIIYRGQVYRCNLGIGVGSEECKERMRIMCRTSNGFEISEYDLKLRGPGDFLGSRQHGLPPFKIADLECDMPMVERIQIVVKDILKRDPLLELPEHECLRNSMKSFFEGELIG